MKQSKKDKTTLDVNRSNRVSRFRGEDSDPEPEMDDDDDVFNNRDNESNFDTMYNHRHGGGKTSIQESESTTLHRDGDKNMKTKTMGSLNSIVTNGIGANKPNGPNQG